MAAGYSNVLEVDSSTTPQVSLESSSTSSVSFSRNLLLASNILTLDTSTAGGAVVTEAFSSTSTVGVSYQKIPYGYASNVITLDTITQPTFGIDAIDQYDHGETSVLTVYGVTGSYTVRWSPSSDTPNAPGSVQLTVVGDSLDESGDGTISVTADRGIVRYLDTGYVWIIQGESFNYRGATLALPSGREAVVLTSPLAAPELRLTAIPDLEPGDMLIWWDVLPSGDVSIEPDASFNASLDVQTFEVEVHVANLGYGEAVTQSLIGNYELGVNFSAVHSVGISKRVTRLLAHESTSSAEAGRGLPAKNIAVDGTHSLESSLAVTAERARAFSSVSSLGFSYQVIIDTPYSVQVVEPFNSTHEVEVASLAHTKPRTIASTHAVSLIVTPVNAVPTITQIQPMTHNIQSIIIGINFGN